MSFFGQCNICLHEFRSDSFLLRHWHLMSNVRNIIQTFLFLETWRKTFLHKALWKRIFDALWTITAIKKINKSSEKPWTPPPPPTPLKALLQNQLWNRGIRKLKGGSHNGCKKRFHANEVNALLYLWTAQLHYSYLEELSPLKLPPPSKKKKEKKRRIS